MYPGILDSLSNTHKIVYVQNSLCKCHFELPFMYNQKRTNWCCKLLLGLRKIFLRRCLPDHSVVIDLERCYVEMADKEDGNTHTSLTSLCAAQLVQNSGLV